MRIGKPREMTKSYGAIEISAPQSSFAEGVARLVVAVSVRALYTEKYVDNSEKLSTTDSDC